MRLRSRLLAILAATSVPLLVFSLLAVYQVSAQEEDNLRNAATARNRATLASADAELRGVIGALRTLSVAASLARGDLQTFHEEARTVLDTQPTWENIQLHDAEGHQLVNARLAWGTVLPDHVAENGSFQRAVQTATPAIGGLYVSQVLQEPGIAVRLPLLRDGRVKSVLTAMVRPIAFQRLLEEQKLPVGWMSGFVGTDGKLIARVLPMAAGTLASGDFRRHVDEALEGWYRGKTIEGADTFTAFTRSQLTGWTVGYAVPSDLLLGSARRSVLMVVLGLALALSVAGSLALVLMRRVTRPMDKLAEQAVALEEGRVAAPVDTNIVEVSRVSAALAHAAKAVEERDTALQVAQDELRAKVQQLQELNSTRARFLAQVAHELRNPLTPLVNGIALLKSNDARPSTQTLAMMERQVAQVTRLVNDLVDIGRIDHGNLEFRRDVIDLRDVVSEAVEACSPNIEARKQRLVHRPFESPIVMLGDAQRLTQVVTNLLTNASKYTPEGGTVEVSSRREGATATVTVQDTGIGFDPLKTDSLFEMFHRLVSNNHEGPSGLGIGLSVAQALAQAHGGRIDAFSEGSGRGARFSLVLPLGPSAALDARANLAN